MIPISWQPSGSIIALFNKTKKQIDFIEKNCLRHGEFSLYNLLKTQNDLLFEENTTFVIKGMEFSRENCILAFAVE